jgi:hypothetical protein
MIVVVGGQGRNCGKTSVICGIIRSIPEAQWTAIKITQYAPAEAASKGLSQAPFAVDQETTPGDDKDTRRYLEAGAVSALWLRTPAGKVQDAGSFLRQRVAESGNAIIESNSVNELLEPDLYFVVIKELRGTKASLQKYFKRANAVVFTGKKESQPAPTGLLAGKPCFEAGPPDYTNQQINRLIRRCSNFSASSCL